MPVRWWRDDADRYRSRPPYVAPPVEVSAAVRAWAFELLTGTPEVAVFACLTRGPADRRCQRLLRGARARRKKRRGWA